MASEESTVHARLESVPAELRYFRLELENTLPPQRLHFLDAETEFQVGPAPTDVWKIQWSPPNLFFVSAPEQPALEVTLGSSFQLEGVIAKVLDVRTLEPYTLLLYENGKTVRRWGLSEGIHRIGRAGKRLNEIRFSDPSVSRCHAQLQIGETGALLKAESPTALTAVNGVKLSGGEHRSLRGGDRIQLGENHLLWVRESEESASGFPAYQLRLLGGFRLFKEQGPGWVEVKIRMEKARLLLSWLLLHHESGPPLERTLELLWPDKPVLRRRKNLSHLLKSTQADLGLDDGQFELLLPRSADSLRINLHCFRQTDVWELPENHPAPLLPEFQEPWVRGLRCQYFLQWLHRVGSSAQRTPILESVTELLRSAEWEEFVYEECFNLAFRWERQDLAKLWYWEYEKRLLESTGDKPSHHLRKAIGKMSELD